MLFDTECIFNIHPKGIFSFQILKYRKESFIFFQKGKQGRLNIRVWCNFHQSSFRDGLLQFVWCSKPGIRYRFLFIFLATLYFIYILHSQVILGDHCIKQVFMADFFFYLYHIEVTLVQLCRLLGAQLSVSVKFLRRKTQGNGSSN